MVAKARALKDLRFTVYCLSFIVITDNIHLFLNNCFVFIAESLRRTPTDTLEISGRTSRGMRRNSMKPGVKHKMSANSEKLSPTGINNNGSKLPASRRKSSSNRRS